MEMKKSFIYEFYKKGIQKIDWQLLLFLLLFLNVKLIVKVFAIILIYALNQDFKFGFRLRSSRLPLFYLLITGIAILNLFLYGLFFNTHYDIAFITGICFWLLSVLAMHQSKLFTEKLDAEIIQNTLMIFFIMNAIVSFANIFLIIIETGAINPFQYQGMYQKYFIGTGDNIKGISFDTSTTNALLNVFGIVYFLKKNRPLIILLCMSVLLLTGSNFSNILILLTLLFIFIFQSTREQKSIIVICFLMVAVFMSKVSPQNNQYVSDFFKKISPNANKPTVTASSSASEIKEFQNKKNVQNRIDSEYAMLQQKGLLSAIMANGNGKKPFIPKPNLNAIEYQNVNDTTPFRKELIGFTKNHREDSAALTIKDEWQKKPGKLISMEQTLSLFRQHPQKLITGDGMACFSSKLAFRATALNLSGGYPKNFAYINNDFAQNHLAVFLYFFTKQKELHSVTNTPDSVYNQLFGEYGLAGATAFLILYVGFFIKRSKNLITAFPFLFILLNAFAFGYWFEQLSIVPFFELIMFLSIKESNLKIAA